MTGRAGGRSRIVGRMHETDTVSPNSHGILIVDDEAHMRRVLQITFEAVGYAIDLAATGREALRRLDDRDYGVIVLDLGLPDIDGIDLIARIRTRCSTPILVLSGRGGEAVRVAALDAGANDFMGKPFPQDEFLARIRVLLRPPPDPTKQNSFRLGPLRIDFRRSHAWVGDRELRLSARETRFLRVLAQGAGAPVAHRDIIDAVWPGEADIEAQNVRVLAAHVRQKLTPTSGDENFVHTQAGIGYRLARGEPSAR